MRVIDLSFENYRNLEKNLMNPCEGINIIHGNNAQGKTNLLESIWLFTGGRSFRYSKDSELINFKHKGNAVLKMNFESGNRENKAEIVLSRTKGREFYLNRVKKKKISEVVGKFCAVVFSPVHLSLIKDGPSYRRKFLDTAICQMCPSYAVNLLRYNKILNQRNVLIKNLQNNRSNIDLLDVWDQKLAEESFNIISKRQKYCDSLKSKAKEFYRGISENKESLNINYENSLKIQDCTLENIYHSLKENLNDDIKQGFTTKGVHRDDLDIKINSKSARAYASQGQQRSAVLSLKLSEAFLLKEFMHENPVLLLDDVMSELDSNRQQFLINNINNWQVFISSCENIDKLNIHEHKMFEMRAGKLEVRS